MQARLGHDLREPPRGRPRGRGRIRISYQQPHIQRVGRPVPEGGEGSRRSSVRTGPASLVLRLITPPCSVLAKRQFPVPLGTEQGRRSVAGRREQILLRVEG